ncbi:hypothetical protein M378DRAFT_16140, partial [Amanita muscaria Koide BX008]
MSSNPSTSQNQSTSTHAISGTSASQQNVAPASNRLYDIPSLENNGSNFQTWKFRIKMVLDIRGLWPVVEGTSACPQDIKSDDYTKWKRTDKEAKAQICLTLKDEPLNGVLHVETSKATWDKLCERYEGKGKQTIAYLIGELFRNTFSDESPLEPQLNAMRHKAHILSSLGLKLEDALVAISMVISLPESYSTLRTILMSTEDKLSPDSVVAQVLIEEKSRRNPAAQVALLARSGGRGYPQAKESKDAKDANKKKCSYCKKKGHTKEECRRLKNRQGKDSKPTGTSTEKKEGELTAKVAAIAEHPDGSEFLRLFVANALNERKSLLKRWLIDSGASSPMSSQRHWFHMYRDLSPPKKVWLGDERYILATGIGQLHLEMNLDNGQKCLTIIRSAYFVPDLSGNLISISYLTKRGYGVNFDEGGCCILNKKSGDLCGVAHEVDNLYILNATPIAPEHAYISHTTREITEESNLDSPALKAALVATVKKSKAGLHTWHRRLGHIAFNAIKKLFNQKMVKGMEINDDDAHESTCVPCLQGKQTRNDIPKESDTTHPRILYRIHSDVCGPMETQSRQGERYFLTFIDGNTHHVKVKLLHTKDETSAALKSYIERAEVETGERVNYFRSDGGGEYGSNELAAYFKSKGIHHEKTNAYTPQENGITEHMNRTIVEMARTLLKGADLPDSYWGFAVNYATYIINRSPTRTLKNNSTPFEAYTGNKPSVSHLRVFGCKAYVHVPDEKRQKLQAKTLECTHLGYSEHKKAYILVHRSSGRIVESRDVHFDEGELVEPSRVTIETEVSQDEGGTQLPTKNTEITPGDESDDSVDLGDLLDVESDDEDDYPASFEGSRTSGKTGHSSKQVIVPATTSNRSRGFVDEFRATPTPPTDSATRKTLERNQTHPRNMQNPSTSSNQPPSATSVEPRRSARIRKAPVRDDDDRYFITSYGSQNNLLLEGEESEEGGGDVGSTDTGIMEKSDTGVTPVTTTADEAANAAVLGDPLSYVDAMSQEDAAEWRKACEAELEMFKQLGVFEEVPRPRDRKIIGSKWVFKTKTGPDGQVEKYKARLVAQGFSQVEGIDYNETFAPVTKSNSIRLLLALAARHDWEIHQMDVKSAFLNGELEEEIYMKVPPGHKASADAVWRLKKALYGLKQASREWYKKLSAELKTLGFTRLQADHCVFYKNMDRHPPIIAVYVDDNMVLSDSLDLVTKTKSDLGSRFDMTDLGEVCWILNMEVTRNRQERTIRLSQSQYIEDILERHGMAECKPVHTPMDSKLKLEKLHAPEVNVKEYQRLIGSLMYAAIATRFDIATAVGMLSRHSQAPGKEHHIAVKRVFRYLRGASESDVLYDGKSPTTDPVIYTDADWAGDSSDRKSISGYTAILSGAAISWSSKKQSTVSLSSTEAEYIAAARGTQEATWIQTFLSEIGLPLKKPITLYVDNQSAIKLIQNPVAHDRTKHIDVKYHFIRDAQDKGLIKVEYCPTN